MVPAGAAVVRPLKSFAAVVMRKDPPFDMEYVYSTYLLEIAETQGARVFNRPRAMRDYNEKLAIAKFAEFIVPTLVTRDAALLREFIDEHEDVILKPLDGMGGTSGSASRQGRRQPQRHRRNGRPPRCAHGDGQLHSRNRRGRQAHRAHRRRTGADTRSRASPSPARRAATWRRAAAVLRARCRHAIAIAETVAAKLWADGMLVVGLDVIGDHLTEVNEPDRLRRNHQANRV